MRKSEIVSLLLVIVSLLISFYFAPKLPETIPSHWNYKGEVDGYMAKFLALFLMPVFLLVLFLLFLILPKIDPLKANVEKFRRYFDGFIIILFLFFIAIHLQIFLWARGTKIPPNIIFPIGFGILFYYVGIMLNHSQRNWFIGIKTPWTLQSDFIWDKTHKLGAKLFKMAGIASIIGIIFKNFAILFVIAPAIIFSVYLFIYSYLEYKKESTRSIQ